MRLSILIVVFFVSGPLATADEAARAKAAIEVAKAKAELAKAKAKDLSPLAAAKEAAKTNGRPLFVSTCATCVATCAEIKKLGDVIHVAKEGDQAFFRVQVWDNDGNWLYFDWSRLPTPAEAKAKVSELQSWIKKPPTKQAEDFRISLPASVEAKKGYPLRFAGKIAR